MKFYKCDICGKIVAMVKATDVDTVCCGKPMRELVAGKRQVGVAVPPLGVKR